MGSYKNIEQSPKTQIHLEAHEQSIAEGRYEPLFGRGNIDNGGVAVLDNGDIVAVRSPDWQVSSPDPEHRVEKLRMRHDGDRPTYIGDLWIPHRPTVGSEMETAAILPSGSPWEVLPDGLTLRFPGGSSESAENAGFQFEALKRMLEYGTREVRGYDEYFAGQSEEEVRVEQYLENKGLFQSPLSLDPLTLHSSDISDHPYIGLVTRKMPYHLEFVASMTSQMHVQIHSLEDALAAANNYQAVQAVFTYAMHGAPFRDGHAATDLGAHYRENPDPEFKASHLAGQLINRYGSGAIPADWRELARATGSPSGGVYTEPTPHTANEYLDRIDRLLRAGTINTADRGMGLHTDRIRPVLGTFEIGNMGRGGGNIYRLRAVHETVAKFIVALQLFHDGGRQRSEANELFGYDDTSDDRVAAVRAGRQNAFEVAIRGNQTELVTPAGNESLSMTETFRRIITFTNEYNPVAVNPRSVAEIEAAMGKKPAPSSYRDAESVLVDGYKPETPFTHAEALRTAATVEPELTVQELAAVNAKIKRAHTLSFRR